jgi:hypothetical protein
MNAFSSRPAERRDEKVWTLLAENERLLRTAENTAISRSFPASGLTGCNEQHCYTFERFASCPDEIRTYYYYHYEKDLLVLKEETTWS